MAFQLSVKLCWLGSQPHRTQVNWWVYDNHSWCKMGLKTFTTSHRRYACNRDRIWSCVSLLIMVCGWSGVKMLIKPCQDTILICPWGRWASVFIEWSGSQGSSVPPFKQRQWTPGKLQHPRQVYMELSSPALDQLAGFTVGGWREGDPIFPMIGCGKDWVGACRIVSTIIGSRG